MKVSMRKSPLSLTIARLEPGSAGVYTRRNFLLGGAFIMSKKSLISGSVILLIVMLFALAGCEGPVGPAGSSGTDGSDGGDGKPGGTNLASTDVTGTSLAAAFTYGNVVILEAGVETVYGVVPEGCELVVWGKNTAIASGQKLDVRPGGKLTIWEGAILEADGVDSGYLVPNTGITIGGAGALVLPYVVNGAFTEGFTYGSEEVEGVLRYVGSTSTGGKKPEVLTSAAIKSIFSETEETELTVQNIDPLTAAAIPEGKKLTLVGTGNEATAGLTLAKGELVVAQGAILEVGSGTLTTGVGGKITNLGTIDLDDDGAAKLGQGSFVNTSVIKTATTDETVLAALFKLSGPGKIESSGTLGDALPAGGLVFTTQKLHITGGSVTFPAEATPASPEDTVGIYIGVNGILILDAESTSVGTKVENKGLIRTEAANTTALLGIFESMENNGKVEATEAVTDLDADFTIPPLVTLELSAASTFDGGTAPASKVTVNGKLELGTNAALQSTGEVVINGELEIADSGTLTIEDGKTITISGKVSGAGTIIYGGSTDGEKFIKLSESDVAATYGLKTNSIGLVCNDFNTAKELILETKALLEAKEEYEANGSYKAPYIGIAQPTKEDEGFPIIFDSTWSIADDTFKFLIPQDMTVSKNGGGVLDADVASDLFDQITGVDRSTFKLVVTNGFLCLSDSDWRNPGTNPSNVATFNTLQFEYKNLIGPAVESFNIAFQTGR
jgi:hypothetical protein